MTFLQLQTALDLILVDDDDGHFTADVKKQFLDQAHSDLYMELYDQTEWKLASTTVTTEDGTQEYDLPLAFMHMRRVYIDAKYELGYDHHHRPGMSDDKGKPTGYYITDSHEINGETEVFAQIGFRPVPDAVYTIAIDYYPIPFTLSADDDVSGIPTPFHDLIVTMAIAKLYKMPGMYKDVTAYLKEETIRKNQMVAWVIKRQRPYAAPLTNAFGGG